MRTAGRPPVFFLLAGLTACAAPAAVALQSAPPTASGAAGGLAAAIELVETAPVETQLGHPDLREAYQVWLEMIARAREDLDIAEFYLSNSSDAGTRLEPVIAAVEAAAGRGVRVRVLAEEKFYKTYPETIERLGHHSNIEVRRFDVGKLTGGVLHAKYFIVDRAEAYLGSQNFDWRSLEHIQELGVRTTLLPVVEPLQDVFDMDWALAGGPGGHDHPPRRLEPKAGLDLPAVFVSGMDTVRVWATTSPKGLLPNEKLWDLPQLVALIDRARSSVRVQLLTYKTTGRDHEYFGELETALRAAAARGVSVQLLLADWCKRKGTIEGLQSLQLVPGIDVKLITIPEAQRGHIPFARVAHAKYLVVDGRSCWVGTSNWERDYFYASRNVGVIVAGTAFAGQLDRFFASNWSSPYAYDVEPCAAYEAPRVGE